MRNLQENKFQMQINLAPKLDVIENAKGNYLVISHDVKWCIIII
jgi:hypothetical protein